MRNEPSFTLVTIEIGTAPKAIEFVLNPPADVPPARSKLVETLEVFGALGKRRLNTNSRDRSYIR